MMENWSGRAKKAMQLAEAYSLKWNHSNVQPRHLLYGTVEAGIPLSVLGVFGGDRSALCKAVEKSLPPWPTSEDGKLDWSVSMVEAVTLANGAAKALGHKQVETGHVLMGIMALTGLEPAREILVAHGGSECRLEAVMKELSDSHTALPSTSAVEMCKEKPPEIKMDAAKWGLPVSTFCWPGTTASAVDTSGMSIFSADDSAEGGKPAIDSAIEKMRVMASQTPDAIKIPAGSAVIGPATYTLSQPKPALMPSAASLPFTYALQVDTLRYEFSAPTLADLHKLVEWHLERRYEAVEKLGTKKPAKTREQRPEVGPSKIVDPSKFL